MALPIYKKIIIKSAQPRQINSQLDQIDFGENPFIFEFVDSIPDHVSCIGIIEEYFKDHEINTFSYPIFFVTEAEVSNSNFKTITKSSLAPSFFRQKSKQLTVKETQKLEVVKLKQLRLNSLRPSEFKPQLEEYGSNSKKISLLQTENFFYQNLIEELKGEENA